MTNQLTNRDVYAKVTAALVAALDAGEVPWIASSWPAAAEIPINATTRRPYSGVNVLITTHAATTHRYTSPAWLTAKQARTEGLAIRRGETPVPVLYMNRTTRVEEPDPVFIAKWYSLFNLDQLEGEAQSRLRYSLPAARAHDPVGRAIRLVELCWTRTLAGLVPPWSEQYSDAYAYMTRDRFPSAGTYWGALLHRVTRAIGAAYPGYSIGLRFGDVDGMRYAGDALVSELAAVYLARRIGLTPLVTLSGAHIAQWRDGAAAHPDFLVASASAASKIVASMLALDSSDTPTTDTANEEDAA